MNQRTFFRLLNLYIDGEIAPSDASQLEEEILRNPRRRRVYDDYCRIHRATKLVYDRFREAAASQGLADVQSLHESALGSPVPIHRTRSHWMNPVAWTVTASAALAACLLLVSGLRSTDSGQAEAIASGPQEPAPQTAASAVQETSFPAPFAAETRADPYLPQLPVGRSNSLLLVSLPAGEPEWRIEASLPPRAEDNIGFTPFGQIQTAQPAGWGGNESQAPRVFRSSTGAAPVQLEPVGFRIHR